ncbi:hypothetical protein D3C75_633310 [compost metagenome]
MIITKSLTPILDQRRKRFVITSLAPISRALIPQYALQRIRGYRRNHPVIKCCWRCCCIYVRRSALDVQSSLSQRRHGFERFIAGPVLDLCSAYRRENNADWNACFLCQLLREEITYCCKPRYCFRRSHLPFLLACNHGNRVPAGQLRNGKETDVRVIRITDFRCRIGNLGHRKCHIRLPGCQIYITEENISKCNCLPRTRHGDRMRIACLIDSNRYIPIPVSIGSSRESSIIKLDAYLGSRLRPAPDRHFLISLQNHVAAEYRIHKWLAGVIRQCRVIQNRTLGIEFSGRANLPRICFQFVFA